MSLSLFTITPFPNTNEGGPPADKPGPSLLLGLSVIVQHVGSDVPEKSVLPFPGQHLEQFLHKGPGLGVEKIVILSPVVVLKGIIGGKSIQYSR